MKKKCVKLMCLVLGIVMVSAFAVYAGAEKKEPAPEEKPVTVKEPAKAPACSQGSEHEVPLGVR